jgi:deoxycytidylate deaminase
VALGPGRVAVWEGWKFSVPCKICGYKVVNKTIGRIAGKNRLNLKKGQTKRKPEKRSKIRIPDFHDTKRE